jgi:hypothetical protein
MVSPTINYSYTPDRGWTWIETYFTAQFFTNNNSFFVNGARTLAQNPIFRVEEHISRNLTDRFWLSADTYYNVGGETSIDDATGQRGEHAPGRGRHGLASVARR